MIGNYWWRLGRTFRARAEPESFDLLPDNRLQVCGTYRGICRPTGRELNAEFIHILTFAESGKITRLRQLTDTAIWCDAFDGGHHNRYLVSPAFQAEAERRAMAAGLDVIGFYQ